MIHLGYRVTIMSRGERSTTGTIEPGGYAYEALIFDQPSAHGIDRGRISKLRITDKEGKVVVEYDRGFNQAADGRQERPTKTQARLIKAMVQTFPGRLDDNAKLPALTPGKPEAADRAEPRPDLRPGLDKHKLVASETMPPPQKLFVPRQRVRFAGFSCTMPPGCPEPDRFKHITKQAAKAQFGSEEKAAAALRAYEEALDTKGQFKGYPDAVERYQQARVAASPQAQQWEAFEDELRQKFDDYDEEGRDKEPAIRGWSALHVGFRSDESERGERIDAMKDQTRASRGDDGREID